MKKGLQTLLYIVNFILYLVVIAIWLIMPEEFFFCMLVTVLNLIFTVSMIIWDRKRVRDYYLSSHFRHFTQAFIAAFLFLCVLGMVNYFAYKSPIHFDTTFAQRNSLTTQTHQILDSIDEKITFDIYARSPDFVAIRGLVELYRLRKHNIELNYIDVELRPDRVQAAGIQKAGTIIVRIGDRQERVEELSELQLTNALVRLTRERDPVVVFLTGFGTPSIEGDSPNAISHLTDLIIRSNYNVQRMNIMNVDHIPSGADVAVLWGPTSTLDEDEVNKIKDYIERGGTLVVALNPDLSRDAQPLLRSFLRSKGLYLRNDLVIDQIKHISGSDGTVPLIDSFQGRSSLTKEFEGSVFFPLVSSVSSVEHELSEEVLSNTDVITALRTSPFPASWAEQSMDEVVSGQVTYNEGVDIRGPVSLAGTVEYESDDLEYRIVVFGNSTFVSNNYKRFEKNYQLFLNAISWASGEDQLISLNVPVLSNEPVFISSPQLAVIFYFCVFFAPLALFAFAFLIYRRKVTG